MSPLFGEEKKVTESKSDEQGGCSSMAIYFWPKIPRCSRNSKQEHCRDGTAM